VRKTKRYTTLLVVASILLGCLGESILALSCNSPASSTSLSTAPVELPPTYNIDVPSTPEIVAKKEPYATVGVVTGSSTTIPITVTSMSDTAMDIRLVPTPDKRLPDTVTFNVSQEYVTIEPGKSIAIPFTITAARSTSPGTFGMGLIGSLKKAVKGRNLSAQMFLLVVIDNQS
jgi:hypothetical protein